jgi:hypothetical protein
LPRSTTRTVRRERRASPTQCAEVGGARTRSWADAGAATSRLPADRQRCRLRVTKRPIAVNARAAWSSDRSAPNLCRIEARLLPRLVVMAIAAGRCLRQLPGVAHATQKHCPAERRDGEDITQQITLSFSENVEVCSGRSSLRLDGQGDHDGRPTAPPARSQRRGRHSQARRRCVHRTWRDPGRRPPVHGAFTFELASPQASTSDKAANAVRRRAIDGGRCWIAHRNLRRTALLIGGGVFYV